MATRNSQAPTGTPDLCASDPERLYREERGDNTQGEEKVLTLSKHLGRKPWKTVIIETPKMEGRIRETISEIMFIIPVMFACVKQPASVPSQRDPPAWNLNSGDAPTLSLHILGLLEAGALA